MGIKKSHQIRILCVAAALILTLASCGLPGVYDWLMPVSDDVSPSATPTSGADPSAVTASGMAAPWPLSSRQRYNELFGLAWDGDSVVHPIDNNNRFNHDVYTLVYESLFVLDERFEPQPWLCKSISTVDSVVFTLSLQSEVTFHDGEPLTAADVVYSLQKAREQSSAYASQLRCIAGVRAEGDSVVITLGSPNSRLAALLTFPVVRSGSKSSGFPWAGTGPYRFSSVAVSDETDSEPEQAAQGDPDATDFNSGSEVFFLEIYTAWWKHDPLPLGHIELCHVSRLDELPYLVGVGDVSAVVKDPGDSFGVGFNGDFVLWDYPTTILQYVGVNSLHPLLGDARMRRALSAGFDRDGLAAQVYSDAADPTLLPIPPASPLYGASGSGYDLRYMTELLEELNLSDEDEDGFLEYPAGRSFVRMTLRFLVEEEDRIACRAVEFLCRSLQSVGLDAVPTPLPRSSFKSAVQSGDYELYYSHERVAADFNLRDRGLLGAAGTDTSTPTGLSFATATSMTDSWLSQMPSIPLVFRRQYLITQRSAVNDATPLYLRPFNNFSEWQMRQ